MRFVGSSVSGNEKLTYSLAASKKHFLQFNVGNVSDKQLKKESIQTVDSMTMLSQAGHEIPVKRKSYVKLAVKPEYKGLCSSTPITSQLFGDTLGQDIIDMDLKKKLMHAPSDPINRQHHFCQNSFLAQGSSRGPPPRYHPYKRKSSVSFAMWACCK